MNLFVQVLLGSLVPVTGLLTYLLNRKHRNRIETQDSTAAAMQAVTDSAHKVVDIMGEVMDPVQKRLDEMQRQIDSHQQEARLRDVKLEGASKKIRELDALVHTLLSYTQQLRQQLLEAGLEPHPFPASLTEFENFPYNMKKDTDD